MPKNKPNKGLLKRIRITKSGKVKMGRAFGRHLRSGKPASQLRSYRRPKYALGCDIKRLRPMLFCQLRGANNTRLEDEAKAKAAAE